MKMEKKKFRIGQLADLIGVERFVIRFWEKEFNISSTRSHGGQRFYTEQDLRLFTTIKTLLYHEGFTITGAKKKLEENTSIKSPLAVHFEEKQDDKKQSSHLAQKTEWNEKQLLDEIVNLKKQLSKLRELL